VQAENLINNYTEKVFVDLKSVSSPQLIPHINIIISKIESVRKNIISLLQEEGDEEKKYKAFFEKIVIQKLFQGQLNNINSKDEILEIKITEGATQLINISVSNNKIQSFIVENPLLLNDATLIETPTILQLAKFITTTLAFPSALKKLFQQRAWEKRITN